MSLQSIKVPFRIGSVLIVVAEVIVDITLDLINFENIKSISDLFDMGAFQVFVASVVILIFLNLMLFREQKPTGTRLYSKLPKSEFYDVATHELSKCLETRDIKSFKKIKKMVDMIEK